MLEIQSYLQKKKIAWDTKLIDVPRRIQLQYTFGRHPSVIVELSSISLP